MRRPLKTIAENAGKNGEVVLEKCLSLPQDSNEGYNVATDTYENLMAAGVIDPLKVTRTALENAAAVAGLLLLTECAIVTKRETK
jgi:chaperonin GroEL